MLNFKHITVYQVLKIIFYLFICYACIDVVYKVIELKKYDTEKLLLDIQKKYPKATLTFQNIAIEGNHLKEHSYEERYDETYFESTNIYVRNNKLHKEPNFLWVLYGFAPLLFLTIFHQDPRTLKIKDLNKVSLHTSAWIFGSIFFSIIIHFTSEDEYYISNRPRNEFNYETKALIEKTNLDDYKYKINE